MTQPSMDLTEQQVKEFRSLNRNTNFAMVPYIVNDMPLSIYAKVLYTHIVRRAGALDDGLCFENCRNMAQSMGMSVGKVSQAKWELVDSGLISITKHDNGHGEFPNDVMTLNDIKRANAFFYSPSLVDKQIREWYIAKYGPSIIFAVQSTIQRIDELLDSQDDTS